MCRPQSLIKMCSVEFQNPLLNNLKFKSITFSFKLVFLSNHLCFEKSYFIRNEPPIYLKSVDELETAYVWNMCQQKFYFNKSSHIVMDVVFFKINHCFQSLNHWARRYNIYLIKFCAQFIEFTFLNEWKILK